MKPVRPVKCPSCKKQGAWFDGKYGPYVKHGDLNASVPKGTDSMTFALAAAVVVAAAFVGTAAGARESGSA